MMFNVAVFKYELSDFINEKNDKKFTQQYREYFRQLDNRRRADIFEHLRSLPPIQLARLRLEHEPRTKTHYETLFIIPTQPENRTYVIFKNDMNNPPSYHVT